MACDLASVLLALKLVTPYLEETHEFDRTAFSQSSGAILGSSGTAPTTATSSNMVVTGGIGMPITKKDVADRIKEEIKAGQERLAQLEKEKAAEVLRNANIKKAKDLAKQCK